MLQAAVLISRPDVNQAMEELHNPRASFCFRMWQNRAVVSRMAGLRIWFRHTLLSAFTRYDPHVSRFSRYVFAEEITLRTL